MPTPRYKIRPDTGELQEYLFEYNGILALKNFVARVDGERLILHSGADMNFSILDALVSEVEIDGRVYDNAEAAQEALMRLTFNTNRPVLMTQQERELLQGALQRGTYVGTAADLKALIDGKVDKVPGKGLSTNDFTNELRTKLEGLRNVDISGLLPKGGYTGTAQNLKELIDNIMRILQSPDTELDELREIVAYIKQNKRTLDTLGIGNIAGLQDALNGKAPTDHNHDDRYSRLGHTHSEYAYRTHRHNWDDIDGKPALATEGKIQEAIGKIQVGVRNFVLKSRFETSKFANLLSGNATDYPDSIFGNVVRVLRPVDNGNFQYVFNLVPYDYSNKDLIFMLIAKPLTSGKFNFGKWDKTYNSLHTGSGSNALGNGWRLFWTKVNVPDIGSGAFGISSLQGDWLFYACGVFEGNTLVNWSPAPEDLLVSNNARASSSITLTHAHNNATIFLEGITGVDMTGLEDLDSVSFRKCFATGHVNFVTHNGKQIVYTGDSRNMQEGGEGSTAVVSVYGNRIYVDIRNV